MKELLAPTLWRTCRALANRRRLEALAWLFERGEATVSQCADRMGCGSPSASVMLRQLQSRGLISAHRKGRWVSYRPAADPAVAQAALLLEALRASLHETPDREQAFQALTAFTHPRRIRIVRALAADTADFATLQKVCAISPPALKRHLRKLIRRGVVARGKNTYRLPLPQNLLAGTLLQLALDPRGHNANSRSNHRIR